MEVKLNHRLHQTADRLAEFETGVEEELRQRLILTSPAATGTNSGTLSEGIVSVDGNDVDNDSAPCAVTINSQDPNAIDVGAGTVVFSIGELVVVGATDLVSVGIDTSVTDAQVIRLEYGEVADGDPEGNPYYNFASQPKTRKKTPAEMLVVETATAFSAQAPDVRARSVVLGVVRFQDGILTADNGRDTYSYSRPWFSPRDAEHRSLVGTGLTTPTNPHGTSLNDLTVGDYTAWQALVGQPACVIARPQDYGRVAGEVCSETIPSGSFATDPTGFITGVAGALFAPLGFWPEQFLLGRLSTGGTEVASWIPKGRNVVAVFDPVNFAAAADLDVFYTRVQAGALPGNITGLTSFDVGQPVTNEVIVAGGNFYTELTETKVTFTDVGLVPMKFDILVDNTGRAYKSPDVIYCNTLLNTLGTSPQPFELQPRAPSRLRLAISGYQAGFTEVRFVVSGTAEDGSAISEVVTFLGPASTPQTSLTGEIVPALYTANIFATTTQIQVQVRNGDGANTTLTVFAEQTPERPGTQDDLLLATVQWTGSEVNNLYTNDPYVAYDRRLVTRGGGTKGLSGVGASIDNPMLVDSLLGYLPTGADNWATIVEDFADPKYIAYPQADLGVQGSTKPVELPANSLGARNGYTSRIISTGNLVSAGPLDALWMRMIPKGSAAFPARVANFTVSVTIYTSAGSSVLTGTLGSNPFPPYQVQLSGGVFGVNHTLYGVKVDIAGGIDPTEVFQGFILHARD